MSGMFYEAYAFNQDIGAWDTTKVTSFFNMFYRACSFCQTMSAWGLADPITTLNLCVSYPFCYGPNGNTFTTNDQLRVAVDFWCAASTPAEGDALTYGPISEWNTSLITAMNYLFSAKYSCNPPISKWDTSKVNDMHDIVSYGVESIVYVLRMYVCMYILCM